VDAPKIVPRTTAVAIMLLMMVMLKLVTTAASTAVMAAEMMVEDIDCKYVHIYIRYAGLVGVEHWRRRRSFSEELWCRMVILSFHGVYHWNLDTCTIYVQLLDVYMKHPIHLMELEQSLEGGI